MVGVVGSSLQWISLEDGELLEIAEEAHEGKGERWRGSEGVFRARVYLSGCIYIGVHYVLLCFLDVCTFQ